MYTHQFELTCLAFDLLPGSQGYLQNKPSLNSIHLGHFKVRHIQNILFGMLGILNLVSLSLSPLLSICFKPPLKKKTEAFFLDLKNYYYLYFNILLLFVIILFLFHSPTSQSITFSLLKQLVKENCNLYCGLQREMISVLLIRVCYCSELMQSVYNEQVGKA